jgi:hypothetical protein
MFDDAPAALQSLKPSSLANIHLYVARSYLTRTTDPGAIERAGESLAAAFRLQPAMFADATALRLLLRWGFTRVVSLRAAAAASELFHRLRRGSVPEVDPWA